MPTDILVLVNRPIRKLTSGYDARVYNLCRQTRARLHLYVISLGEDASRGAEIDRSSVFSTIEEFDHKSWGRPSPRRHLRTSEADFLRLAYPGPYHALLDRLRGVIAQHGIRKVVAFGASLAGIARDLEPASSAIDICDSQVLRLNREAQVGRESLSARLRRWRWTRTEADLPRWFDVVTTIGPPDTNQLVMLSGEAARGKLHSIPNGVGEQFVSAGNDASAPDRRGVAFWGNLPFGPNREAMRYFFQQVYLPHLRSHRVEVCVIGRDPEPWLSELAANDPHVKVLGFVDDLAKEIAHYPVMINPMVTGGGMKNKVLEAFGLHVAVVSTPLGIDAIPEAKHGVHLLMAEDPQDFATSVLLLLDDTEQRRAMTDAAFELLNRDYRWNGIGDRWNRLLGLTAG